MGKDTKRAVAEIPKELHERAKQNANHGELTQQIRKAFEAIAEGREYDPEINTQTATDVYEALREEDRPSDWPRRRERVFERDNWMCQNCESRGGIDGPATIVCHHVVPVHTGGNHYLSNLITLCKDCHDKVHNSY
jgi:5-methylcytosine-specific restriction endonuclease McrA